MSKVYFAGILVALFLTISACHKKTKKVLSYYSNGQAKVTITYNEPITADSVGFLQEYYENGDHKSAVFQKNGKLNGRWEFYSVPHTIQEHGEYLNGKKTGTWHYYSNGLDSTTTYLDNGDSVIKILKL